MTRVLILDPEDYSRGALKSYASLGEVRAERLEGAGLLEALKEIEVLVIRLTKITRGMIDAAPNLKVIASPTTGLNHIDLGAAEEKGIKVISLKGRRDFLDKIFATSEHTMALMLALLRRIPAAFNRVLSGEWNRQKFVGQEISGKTIGIVGLGRLGTRVAEIANAMGAKIIAADPHANGDKAPQYVTMVQLPELLAGADIVSVHIPLEKETENLFGEHEFQTMKQGAFFINTSRGEVVNESALLRALESGHLGGAAVDVMAGEDGSGAHLAGNSLISYAKNHDNLIITPHLGGATRESMALTEELIAREVVAFLKTP